MSTHEIRYKGKLFAHMSEAAANEYVRARFADEAERKVLDEDDWSIGPRKPFELHSRGNLVDTFATEEGAHRALERAAEELDPTRFPEGTDLEAFFTVVETDVRTLAPPPPPPPTTRERRPSRRAD